MKESNAESESMGDTHMETAEKPSASSDEDGATTRPFDAESDEDNARTLFSDPDATEDEDYPMSEAEDSIPLSQR